MSEQELIPKIPRGWVKVIVDKLTLDEKSAIRMGPFGSQLKKHELVNSGIRVLWIENVVNNQFEYKNGKFITKEKFQQLSGFRVKPNDILITMMGTIGRTCIVPNDIDTAIISSHLLKISLDPRLCNSKFLELTLRGNPIVIKQMEKTHRGAVMKGLNTKIIKNLFFLLPPLNEQNRIVSKIEELFSNIDSIKKSLEKTKLQLKQYRESLLKSVFERKSNEDWEIVKIDELSKSRKIGLVKSISQQSTSGIPYVKMNNISIDGQLDLTSLVHVNCSNLELEKFLLEKNDILFNTRNSYELVGKTCIWDNSIKNCIFNNNIMRIKTNSKILPKYLCYFMNSNMFKTRLLSVKRATTNICAVYDKDLKEQLVTFPKNIKQQEQIVFKIEQGFSLIENNQQIVNSTLQKLETMKMSILKQAFEGKLIPQDPNDEPAEKLLERIKMQKNQY